MRIRFEFSKDKEAKYISHLDMIRVFERTARRAGLPLTYSQGFNPHPKIAFGPALALGTASDKEYVDISFEAHLDVDHTLRLLNEKFPPGVRILRGIEVPQGAVSLNALINRARYSVTCALTREVSENELEQYCQELLQKENIMVTKSTKKGLREKDIRKGIYSLECKLSEGKVVINCELQLSPEGSVRPEDVVKVLVSQGLPVQEDFMAIRRIGLFNCLGKSCTDPVQVLV
jgi:radical SAM-linked protein